MTLTPCLSLRSMAMTSFSLSGTLLPFATCGPANMLRGNTLSRTKASSLSQLPDKLFLCWGLAGFWPTGKSNLKWEPTTKWAGLSCLLNKQGLVKEAAAYALHGADSASKAVLALARTA